MFKDSLCYFIRIGKLNYLIHRLVYEKTITGKKIDEGNVIDHIKPVRSVETINNEFFNLREVTPSENSNNIETLKLIGKECKKYSLRGDLMSVYISTRDAGRSTTKKYISINSSLNGKNLVLDNSLWCFSGDENKIKDDLKYIYYRFDKDGNIIKAAQYLTQIISNELKNGRLSRSTKNRLTLMIRKEYLNTGMPAPDGYYYQQGYPDEFLCDPDNKDLVKKREEIKWKPKDKR